MSALKHLSEFPRNLNADNIGPALRTYEQKLRKISVDLNPKNVIEFLSALKRKKLTSGPYKGVSLFEAANRIMTDLVILHGVKILLNTDSADLAFPSYKVEFGNENRNDHDIKANKRGRKLIGEAFNVAPSFFPVKSRSAITKLKKSNHRQAIKVLMYNQDASKAATGIEIVNGIYHIRVDIAKTG